MAMDNHYILYYICPLHTFYFLVVYAIMAPASSMNYTKNGMRYKLLIAGAIIFCVWDWDLKIFEKVRATLSSLCRHGRTLELGPSLIPSSMSIESQIEVGGGEGAHGFPRASSSIL